MALTSHARQACHVSRQSLPVQLDDVAASRLADVVNELESATRAAAAKAEADMETEWLSQAQVRLLSGRAFRSTTVALSTITSSFRHCKILRWLSVTCCWRAFVTRASPWPQID